MASFLSAYSIPASPIVTEGKQTQVGLSSVSEGMFANFLKNGNHSAQPSQNNNYPSWTNDSGYPKPTASLPSNTPDGIIWQVPPGYKGNVCIFWTGQGAITFDPGGITIPRMTVIEDTQGFVTSSNYSLNAIGTMNGTTHRIIIAFNVDASRIAFAFPSGQAYSQTTQMSKMVICRAQDEAICRANENAFFPPYIQFLMALRPKTIRVMDVVGTNSSSRAQSKYDPPATSVCFGSDTFTNAINVGNITATVSSGNDAYTSGSYADMPSVWTDKEQFQGQMVTANTQANATINVAGRGAKRIVNQYRSSHPTGAIGATTLMSFIYDAALDVVHTEFGGFKATVPLPILILLANAIDSDLWVTLPHLTDDASATYMTTTMVAGLVNRGIIEYANEVWNFGGAFQQTGYALEAAAKMGVTNAGNEQLMSWYAKRVTEIGKAVKLARGGSTKVAMTMACQGYSSSWINDLLRFQGMYAGDGSAPIQITNITNAVNPIVTTGSAHDLAVDQIICIQGNAAATYGPVTGMANIQGELFSVASVIDTTHFVLNRATRTYSTNNYSVAVTPGTALDTTGFGTYTGGGCIFKCPVAPNRAIDQCDIISFATYYYGKFYRNFDYSALDTAKLTTLYNKAVANDLAWLDEDFRDTHPGNPGDAGIGGFATQVYPGWNALFAKYPGRSAEGYEGANEMCAPSGNPGAANIPTGDQWAALGLPQYGGIASTFLNDTFTKNAHGLTADMPVSLYRNGGNIPEPFLSGGDYAPIYYPVSITTNTFKLSATKGGPAIVALDTTSPGAVYYSIGAGICTQFLRNYKNSQLYYVAILDAMTSFKTGLSNAVSAVYSWFQIFGPGQWACCDGSLLDPRPHQSFEAMRYINRTGAWTDLLPPPYSAAAKSSFTPTHYVDTVAGLTGPTWAPGNIIALKAGNVYAGPIVISQAKLQGTQANPVIITSYGTGSKPIITGNSTIYSDCLVLRGSDIIVDGIAFKNTNRNGVLVEKQSGVGTQPTRVTVQNCEMFNLGIGTTFKADGCKWLNNYAHNLTMVINDTSNPDNDYGANGVLIAGGTFEVGYCRVHDARAPSFDYGVDGGAVEFFASGTISGGRIHHIWCQDSNGFIEGGGSYGTNAQINDMVIEYCVSINNGQFAVLHNGTTGAFDATWSNCIVRYCSIIEENQPRATSALIFLDIGGTRVDGFNFNNNLAWVNDQDSFFKQNGANYHSNNTFYSQNYGTGSGKTHWYNNWDNTLSAGEVMADPMFADRSSRLLTLKIGSPGVGRGAFP